MMSGHHFSKFIELLMVLEKAMARWAAWGVLTCPVTRPFVPRVVGIGQSVPTPEEFHHILDVHPGFFMLLDKVARQIGEQTVRHRDDGYFIVRQETVVYGFFEAHLVNLRPVGGFVVHRIDSRLPLFGFFFDIGAVKPRRGGHVQPPVGLENRLVVGQQPPRHRDPGFLMNPGGSMGYVADHQIKRFGAVCLGVGDDLQRLVGTASQPIRFD